VKKALGLPRKSSKHQDRLLKRIQPRDQGTTSAELAQKMAVGRCECICKHSEGKDFWRMAWCQAGQKISHLSWKIFRERPIFCKRYRDWIAEDWGKVISNYMGHPERSLYREEKLSTTISPVSC